MKRSKQAEKKGTGLSETELMRDLGHLIRGPLVQIVECADRLMPLAVDGGSATVKSGLAEICGEAYKLLDVTDWLLALLDATLRPNAIAPLDPAVVLRDMCFEINESLPPDLAGYRLVWTIPGNLPIVAANGPLLRRAVQLMIGLLGTRLQTAYVHLDTQIVDSEVVIQANSLLMATSAIQIDLEALILDTVARLSGGKFVQAVVDQYLVLSMRLPIVK